MPGCADPANPSSEGSFRTVRTVPELREIIAAIGDHFERPLETIREAIASLPVVTPSRAAIQPHLATAAAMCDDVADLTRRYLEYIEQAQALPPPKRTPVRPDDLLGELDRQVMPEAFGRGVAWSCALEGPIRPLMTDRLLCLEALLEWATLAVEAARPGDSVSMVFESVRSDQEPWGMLTLGSTADELISNLTSLQEDPLFNRLVCLEEIGTDPGSRLALSLERLEALGCSVQYQQPEGGLIRSVRFRFPAAPTSFAR